MTAPKALTFREAGPRLFAAGFQPILVNGKRPVVKDWQAMSLHEDQIGFWANGDKGAMNVGIRTDDLVAVDLDIYWSAVADEVEAAFRARFGDAIKRVGEAPKRLLLYAAKTPGTKITSPWYKTVDGLEHRVEVLGIGQQFVAHGIHPDTLRAYTWPNGDILDVERWQLPVIDRDEVAEWVRNDLDRILVVRGFMPELSGTTAATGQPGASFADPDDAFDAVKPRHDDVGLEDLRWMLDRLPANYCDDRDSWRDAIFAVHHQFHDTEAEDDALEILIAWSQRSTNYTEGCVEPIWRKASEQRVGARGPATIGTLKAWLGDVWKARRAQVVAVAGAAASADWKARIHAADKATLQGALAVEIRAADMTSADRATLAALVQARWKTLEGVHLAKSEAMKMLAPPSAVAQRPADVDLTGFIPFDFAVPPLNTMGFPHTRLTETGILVKPTVDNMRALMQGYGIATHYDVIRKKAVVHVPGLATCPDQADNAALEFMCSLASINDMPADRAAGLAVSIAYGRPRNVVADFIKSKPWDGQDRLADLQDTLTVRDTFPAPLRNLVLRKWLISAVAAALKPSGFYSKGVLTLQGAQSLGKSPWFMRLLPESLRQDYILSGALLEPDNRDSVKTAVSHWITELGEVDATMRKADIARLKAFLSNPVDKLRLPYARTDSEFQRRTVFAASVNPEEFLQDETGNLRWWVLPVTSVNYRHTLDMQQVWAQLATYFDAGERWWLEREEELQLDHWNAGHVVKSAVYDMLANALDLEAPRITWQRLAASEVLQALGIKAPTNAQAKDCGRALRALLGNPAGKARGTDQWLTPPINVRPASLLRKGEFDPRAFD